MKRNRFLSLFGLLMFAVVSINGQELKDLEKYSSLYTQAKELPPEAKEGIRISLNHIESEKYISEISTVEAAICDADDKDLKKFIKKSRQLIKKAKFQPVSIIQAEGVTTEFYGKEGEIIIFVTSDNDFATISVFK